MAHRVVAGAEFTRKPPPWTKTTYPITARSPTSDLSLISKIIERVVKSRFTDYLSSNNLRVLNPHHSLPTVNIIPLKLLLPTSTIISLTQLDHKKYPVSVYSTYPLLLTQLTTMHSHHSSLILVQDSWLCLKLVQVIPVFPLSSC